MIRSTKEGCNPRWDSFFFVIIISRFPRTRGAFRTGERDGHWSEQVAEVIWTRRRERWERLALSLWLCLRNQSRWIELHGEERTYVLGRWEEISRFQSNFLSKIDLFRSHDFLFATYIQNSEVSLASKLFNLLRTVRNFLALKFFNLATKIGFIFF